jgi:hypothetical protein
MFRDFFVSLYGETLYNVFAFLLYLYPLWLPFLLAYMFWEVWKRYVRYLFFSTVKVVLLEVKLPREITKSPAAMEVLINGFYQTGGEGTIIAKYWEGKTRAWFSLELASLGGDVRFFIWTRENMRQIVEAHIYSQYPDVEVRQVPDYTRDIAYDTTKYEMWAANYKLALNDVLPIKTYIDYGLDKNPKPENEVDPLGTVLEVLHNIKPTEQIWLQFVIRAHKKEKRMGFFSEKTDNAKKVDQIRTAFFQSVKAEGRTVLTDEESRLINALQRSVQKSLFDTGIRVMYIANKGSYNNTTVVSLRGLFRHFSATFTSDLEDKSKETEDAKRKQKHYMAFNTFGHDGTDTDYPWEDFMDIRMNYQKSRKLDAYKRRMFFYAPYRDKSMVFTSEELATLFHFPSSSVTTPGLQRIESKRGQAPSNLPV